MSDTAETSVLTAIVNDASPDDMQLGEVDVCQIFHAERDVKPDGRRSSAKS